jgi:hypothetical protein
VWRASVSVVPAAGWWRSALGRAVVQSRHFTCPYALLAWPFVAARSYERTVSQLLPLLDPLSDDDEYMVRSRETDGEEGREEGREGRCGEYFVRNRRLCCWDACC